MIARHLLLAQLERKTDVGTGFINIEVSSVVKGVLVDVLQVIISYPGYLV